MTESPASRARRALLRLSHRDLDLRAYREAVDAVLRPLAGWDIAAWSTTDPATVLFTSCVVIGLDEDPAREQRLFDLEFRAEDVNRFRDLARAGRPVATLHATTGGDLASSARWRELLSGLGITDELRAVFAERGDCWGSLVAYRTGGEPFGEAETALIAQVAPLIADGLRRCLLRGAAGALPGLPDAPGVLMTDAAGAIVGATPQAEHWLRCIAGADSVPSVVRSVAAAARAAATGGDGHAPAQARLPRIGGGWILLHGSLLGTEGSGGTAGAAGAGDASGTGTGGAGGTGQVAIVVEAAQEIHLADMLVRAYGLTPREREITELVLRGRSTAQIAAELFITPYTVQDHLKSVLAKAEVSSRRDLVAELYGRHYAPATRAGSLPSPYGWYLPGTPGTAAAG